MQKVIPIFMDLLEYQCTILQPQTITIQNVKQSYWCQYVHKLGQGGNALISSTLIILWNKWVVKVHNYFKR